MKFNDPLSAIYYLNPAETTPSHLMLDRNSVWLCQGPVAKKLSVDWPDAEVVETHRNHGARITCMRLFSLVDTPLFRSDTQKDEKALITSSTDRTIRLSWKSSYLGHIKMCSAAAAPNCLPKSFIVFGSSLDLSNLQSCYPSHVPPFMVG
ncbi:unnamed protein product [Urochloa humidicola]